MAQRRSARRSASGAQQRTLLALLFGALVVYLALKAVAPVALWLAQALPAQHPSSSLSALGTLEVVALVCVICLTAAFCLWLGARARRGAFGRGSARAAQRRLALDELRELSPTQFELAVGDLLREWGYTHVRHTGGGGDLAADLICRDRNGARVIVQCKRYGAGASVTSPQMQLFIGMIYAHHRADYGIFVTTSGFTAPARTLASAHHIRLVDGAALAELAQDHHRHDLIA